MRALGYRETGREPVPPGSFRVAAEAVEVHLPARPSPAVLQPRQAVRILLGGMRPTLHGLAAVIDARGRRIDGEPPEREAVLDPRVAYQVTSVLLGVVTSGTGRGAGRFAVGGDVAAKTGTSDEARDSWFAACRPDRVTVVWVGHDEPRPTPLSGSRAALPIWGRYAAAADPPAGEVEPPPPGITVLELCRDSGLLPRPACPHRVAEALVEGQAPQRRCDLHHAPVRAGRRGDGQGPISWLKRKRRRSSTEAARPPRAQASPAEYAACPIRPGKPGRYDSIRPGKAGRHGSIRAGQPGRYGSSIER